LKSIVREIMSAKIKSCEWMSVVKAEIVECKAMPTKLAKRCGKWFCKFHYALGKHFKPFDK